MSFPDVWVQGEVSQVATPASGHIYFTLKDEESLLRCVLFKNKRYAAACLPEEGKEFLLRGKISVYLTRNEVQLVTSYVEAAGDGALRREFDELKNKLQDLGYFDPNRKLALPKLPNHIAIVTSSTGAALQDVLSTIKRRYQLADISVLHTTVQGLNAATEITNMIEFAAQKLKPDVILLVRGGGSAEDLHAFNNEKLALCIAESNIPIVCGVGHETDFTIADFVADLRAPTPTAAAELATPDSSELSAQIASYKQQLQRHAQRAIDERQQHKDQLNAHLRHPTAYLEKQAQTAGHLQHRARAAVQDSLNQQQLKISTLKHKIESLTPYRNIQGQQNQHAQLESSLKHAISQKISRRQQKLQLALAKLGALNPYATLSRGFAIVEHDDGRLVMDSGQLAAGNTLTTTLHKGSFKSKVTSTSE